MQDCLVQQGALGSQISALEGRTISEFAVVRTEMQSAFNSIPDVLHLRLTSKDHGSFGAPGGSSLSEGGLPPFDDGFSSATTVFWLLRSRSCYHWFFFLS